MDLARCGLSLIDLYGSNDFHQLPICILFVHLDSHPVAIDTQHSGVKLVLFSAIPPDRNTALHLQHTEHRLPTKMTVIDEYVYPIPNPKHMPLSTPRPKYCIPQDKHTQMSSFAELCHCLIKDLATAGLPEYVDTHSLLTGYLHP